ncbi:polysaccharide biosynthesis protein [Laribacter hongkongensis]|uniref:polysaccharide biosynthesis protein n=1 Tax=Laribacter hongkongensis TaxID=168471 RepID=UPI000421E78D|nr:nucleoside-diphosphate sugar epimerase/dehydratase [Laribacter hongkongensis]
MDNGIEGSGKTWSVTLKKIIDYFQGSGLKRLHAMTKPLIKLALPILALPRAAKRFIVLSVDLGLCILTVWLAYYLRLGEFVALSGTALWAVGASIGIALPIFIVSGLYRAIFRYSGWPALLVVSRAVGIYGLLYASIFTAIGVTEVPRTVGIIQPILLLLLVGVTRALARVWLGDQYLNILKKASRSKVLIYGAGSTGRQLVGAMANSHEMQVVGFLDDDDRLHGHVLNGQPIYNPSDLVNLAPTLAISDVLLAMPSLSRKRRNEILSQIRTTRVAVRTLPSVTDLAQGKVSVSDLRELDIDDLLGREPVRPNHVLLAMNVRSKVVMVTGAGGSIGSELCRQILAVGPSKLLLIEQSEFALYNIHQELEEKLSGRDIVLVPLLASVQDDERMHEIMSTWHPDTVYHAAAYKHVPLVEHNPAEGIKNNVLGTMRTAKAAAENDVSDFVLISTDKAVRPTNIMGASKRLAEIVLQALASTSPSTKFSMVRFGNVLGSSGSVVPKFRQQIRDGGPITLTHSEITRYFMTIPEASQLVIQAGAMAKGGDVFVLDMGQPVKIMDLARRMIELSGLTIKDEQNPDGDIEIEITGLRPGEKLYEELLIGDNPKPTSHSRIVKAHEEFIPWSELEGKLKALEVALNVNDVGVIRLAMKKLVSGYTPSDEIVDWVYLEQESEVQALGLAG